MTPDREIIDKIRSKWLEPPELFTEEEENEIKDREALEEFRRESAMREAHNVAVKYMEDARRG